jgi:hypothetical protein
MFKINSPRKFTLVIPSLEERKSENEKEKEKEKENEKGTIIQIPTFDVIKFSLFI